MSARINERLGNRSDIVSLREITQTDLYRSLYREGRLPFEAPLPRPVDIDGRLDLLRQMFYSTYSVFANGAGVTAATGSQTLAANLPAGTLTGKLLLLFCTCYTVNNALTTAPSGYVLLQLGAVSGSGIYGKIGTGSESAPTATWTTTSGSKAVHMTALTSSTGWPTIANVMVGTPAIGVVTNGNAGYQSYRAATVPEEGLCCVQWAARTNDSDDGTVTSVAVTSGWAAASTAFRNSATGDGICSSAQISTTLPTMAADVSTNLCLITTNTTNGGRRDITLFVKGATAGGYTYDASSRIDSPYTWLPLFLLDPPHNMGAFAAGDTGQAYGATDPVGADYTMGNNGLITVTFDFPNPSPITIGFVVADVSTGVDHYYKLTFNPPPYVVEIPLALSNVQGMNVGDSEVTIIGTIETSHFPVTMYTIALGAGEAEPTDAVIIAGTDAASNPVPNNNVVADVAGTVETLVVGLAGVTTYDFWAVAVDAAGAHSARSKATVQTTGDVYPAFPGYKTRVNPILNIQVDLSDAGTIRAADVSAQRAYRIQLTHPVMSLSDRDAVNLFIEAHIYRNVDILCSDGFTYRCLLTSNLDWDEISATYVTGTMTLTGNRL